MLSKKISFEPIKNYGSNRISKNITNNVKHKISKLKMIQYSSAHTTTYLTLA